jgi:hypothetical protein
MYPRSPHPFPDMRVSAGYANPGIGCDQTVLIPNQSREEVDAKGCSEKASNFLMPGALAWWEFLDM